MKNKKLIIIAGVTGSIGQELFRKYVLEKDTVIYGISRKGIDITSLDVLPTHNCVLGVDMSDNKSITLFVSKIQQDTFLEVSYFHLLGEFKTEININLQVEIKNDIDKDGIDDFVKSMVFDSYKTMTQELINKFTHEKISIVSFGSLADKHEIECFTSFRKSRELVSKYSYKLAEDNKNIRIFLLSTSTICAVDELLERPFVFATNPDPLFWITPFELVKRLMIVISDTKNQVVVSDIYLHKPSFTDDYFSNSNTFKRRIKEIFNT